MAKRRTKEDLDRVSEGLVNFNREIRQATRVERAQTKEKRKGLRLGSVAGAASAALAGSVLVRAGIASLSCRSERASPIWPWAPSLALASATLMGGVPGGARAGALGRRAARGV